jgi:hypothetical protein
MNTNATTTASLLAEAAAILDNHPGLPSPYVTCFSSAERVEVNWYLHLNRDIEERAVAAQIVRAFGGGWDKADADEQMRFTRNVGNVEMTILVSREEVCERVVVGSETVTLPATTPVPALPERTVEREIVEWRCGSLLAEV